MALWCQGFPIVDVPQSDTPKPITLIKPYFENPRFLAAEMSRFRHYWPDHLRQQWSLIVVDDVSDHPAEDVLRGADLALKTRLFRMHPPKVRWNWLGARNIGAHEADDGWLLITDMDHVVPPSTADALVYGKHDPSVVYGFSRRDYTGAPMEASVVPDSPEQELADSVDRNPHSASFFMTRRMFWTIKGYDERYSGFYGSDGPYRRRLARHAKIQILTDRLICHEKKGDSGTTTFGRKEPYDAGIAKIHALVKADPKPKVLSFPYHEVTL